MTKITEKQTKECINLRNGVLRRGFNNKLTTEMGISTLKHSPISWTKNVRCY